jgi:hypothetical protein
MQHPNFFSCLQPCCCTVKSTANVTCFDICIKQYRIRMPSVETVVNIDPFMHYRVHSLVTNNRQCDGKETGRLEALIGFMFGLAFLCLSCFVNICFLNFYFVCSHLKALWDLIFLRLTFNLSHWHSCFCTFIYLFLSYLQRFLHFPSIIILFTLFLTAYNYILFKKKQSMIN